MRLHFCLSLAAAGALAVLPSGPARSHALESSLERLSALNQAFKGELLLQSRFGNGEPAQEATVRLIPPGGGDPIELGRTDTSGSLRFTLPRQAEADWEVQVDAGPGHRDYLELAESTDAAGASSPSPSSAMANPVRTPGWLRERSPLLGTGLLLGLSLSAAGVLAWRQRNR
jgi:nickel transport protein